MKKMQCEVCGGATIKKVEDDLFECQNCGVQYNKGEVQKLLVEITGEVKIDHSEDAERMVKRAKQYEEKGNNEKAAEYYEKALDYDPDNEELQKNVNKDNDVLENQYVLPPNIESEKAIENLLGTIASKEKLIPDFFTDFKITSQVQKYYPFVLYTSEVKGTFMATACYNVEVPYVTTKTERVRLSNGTYINKEVPVTKTRTEVNRTPASGFFNESIADSYSISPELNKFILTDKISAKNFNELTIHNKPEDDKSLSNIEMFKDIERVLKKLVLEEREHLAPFLKKSFKATKDNIVTYDGFEIAFDTKDKTWADRASSEFDSYIDYKCRAGCSYNCPGDFNENLTYSISSMDTNKIVVWLPIETIEYTYKGETFKALQILNSNYNKINLIYPLDKGSVELEGNLKEKEDKTGVGLAFTVFGLVAIFVGGFFFQSEDFIIPCVITGMLMMVIGLIVWGIERLKIKKAKKLLEEQNNYIDSYTVITNSFIKTYMEEHNIEKAVLKAREINDPNPYNGLFTFSFSSFAEIVSVGNTEKVKVILDASNDKIKAIDFIKKYKGYSLAEAKEFIDKCTNITCSKAEAEKIKAELEGTGIKVKIEEVSNVEIALPDLKSKTPVTQSIDSTQVESKKKPFFKEYKKEIKIISFFVLGMILLILFVILSIGLGEKVKYNNAVELLNSGNYSEAINAFTEIVDYEDSAEKITEARYYLASTHFFNNEYKKAYENFSMIRKYKDSEVNYVLSGYRYAQELADEGSYEEAISILEEVGSNDELYYNVCYNYVVNNDDIDPSEAFEYMKKLKNADYKDSKSIYEKLYSWKVNVIAVNSNEDDKITNKSTVNGSEPIYVHIKVTGGEPDEKVSLEYVVTYPDGYQSVDAWSSDFKSGQTGWIGWDNGLSSYGKSKPETMLIEFYNSETAEKIGEGSFKIVN